MDNMLTSKIYYEYHDEHHHFFFVVVSIIIDLVWYRVQAFCSFFSEPPQNAESQFQVWLLCYRSLFHKKMKKKKFWFNTFSMLFSSEVGDNLMCEQQQCGVLHLFFSKEEEELLFFFLVHLGNKRILCVHNIKMYVHVFT